MIWLGIGGKRGSGKSTLASALIFECARRGIDAVQVPFAEGVKQTCATMTGRRYVDFDDPATKDAPTKWLGWRSPRDLMKDIGALGRCYDLNFWVNRAFRTAELLAPYVAIFPDTRFLNEAEGIREHGGDRSILVRVERPGLALDADPSETSLDDYEGWDYRFTNNGSLGDVDAYALVIVKRIVEWRGGRE